MTYIDMIIQIAHVKISDIYILTGMDSHAILVVGRPKKYLDWS